jgi:hypothetical protein
VLRPINPYKLIALPIAEQPKQEKSKIIVSVAKNNDFLLQTILSLRDKIVHKKNKPRTTATQTQQKN